jgi:hypothetical protein
VQTTVYPSKCPTIPLPVPHRKPTPSGSGLSVLELIKSVSRLRFASLKACSCSRHSPRSTPFFPLPGTQALHSSSYLHQELGRGL